METRPITQEGYQLLHDGTISLALVEANGIRIDMARLARTKQDLAGKLRVLREELEKTELWRVWRKRFGHSAKLTSSQQLGVVLYQVLGCKVSGRTEKGKASTDEEALMKVDRPEIPKLVRYYKYNKALGTFLRGIEREVVGERLHPVFNLHTVVSYRSSSDSPNFQNFPVRDKEVSGIIRSHFTASPKCVLVEKDFKGIEVNISACYHRDANFISYITTPGKDMHRDMAAQIYCLDPKEVSKEARYGAKNKFVFPQFYGDFYIACARNLWEWVEKGKLVAPDGRPLFEHLADQGITELGELDPEQEPAAGTFEAHLKEVEDDFWNNRFQDYGRWRREWYRKYLDVGYFDLFTGFRVHGAFNRKQVCNYPIQGTAFHCLLWTLIQVNKALARYRMKTKVVGQIHDSLISDVRETELKDYLSIVEEIVTVRLRKFYQDWLIVPLEIEYEICPVGGSWFEKKETHFKNGRFQHPQDKTKWTSNGAAFLAALARKD